MPRDPCEPGNQLSAQTSGRRAKFMGKAASYYTGGTLQQMTGWAKIREARQYAGGVSEKTLRSWLKMGLPYSMPGGIILIKFSDIDAFLDQYRVQDRMVEEVLKK